MRSFFTTLLETWIWLLIDIKIAVLSKVSEI